MTTTHKVLIGIDSQDSSPPKKQSIVKRSAVKMLDPLRRREQEVFVGEGPETVVELVVAHFYVFDRHKVFGSKVVAFPFDPPLPILLDALPPHSEEHMLHIF